MVIHVGGLSFLVGSAVCYTSVLLGVFVTYVIDGSRAARSLIFSMFLVALLAWAMAVFFRLQLSSPAAGGLSSVTSPNLRTNIAGIVSTVCASILLAIVWQYLHNKLGRIPLVVKVFCTLLPVFCLDVLIFTTLAFWGQQQQWSIFGGTVIGRLVAVCLVSPLCTWYIAFEGRRSGILDEDRAVFSILQELRAVSDELNVAHGEIALRKQAEAAQQSLIKQLEGALSDVKKLSGLLPICCRCKKIRDGQDYWHKVEEYLRDRAGVEFTHGICPECSKILYPDLDFPAPNQSTLLP